MASNKVIFKGFFSTLVAHKRIAINPCPQNKKVIVQSSKNKAFNREQLNAVKEAIKEDYQLFVFVNTMFYTFARPKELRKLQLKFIDLKNEKITITAEISKNGRERRIEISPHLLSLFKEMKLDKYPGDYFLFGKSGVPDHRPVGVNNFYNRFKGILQKLNLGDSDLTLYSNKHTGVSMHFLNGVDWAALKDQTGHEDTASFMVYLKSLNLIDNERFKRNSPDM